MVLMSVSEADWSCPITSTELGESQTRTAESLRVLRTHLCYPNVCLVGITASEWSSVSCISAWGKALFLAKSLLG